jgi:alkaline phosphatase
MKTAAMVNGGTEEAPDWQPHGYDPAAAWRDFDYVKWPYTDSAAAATAMATGVKTYSGAIGVDVAGRPLKNAIEAAEERGMATGVVTSVQWSHATPAGFLAHNPSRNNYAEIAREMVERSEVDVVMGCGHPWHDADGRRLDAPGTFNYVGGEDTWAALRAGNAGAAVDADHNGLADDAWTLIEDREAFHALVADPSPPKRVLGVPRVAKTLQQGRGGDGHAAPYEAAFVATVPALAEMTRGALNVLDGDPDGLFLMIEGGAVDWAGHSNQSGRAIEEQIAFADAVEAVVEWVEAESGWHETLLVVTADHETGYLTREPSGPDDVAWAYQPLQDRGRGSVPGMTWNSGSHTNSLVPLYAKGAWAERLREHVIGRDPHRGPYVDNTAVAKLTFAALPRK